MDIDRYLDLKIDMFLETQRVDGKKNIHINVYPKYSRQMIIHKVNNCSRGIHTTIFKIKTMIDSNNKGKCHMCQNRAPKLFLN